jgi:S1-C subfamily serine protease
MVEARMSSVHNSNTNALAELSSMLSDAVERASSYIVAIHARRRIPSSGIVWRDGVIVSGSHTVRRDGTMRVALPDGKHTEATVAGRDALTDLVVLRAPELSLGPAPRAEPRAGTVGSLVLAVGRPGPNVSASFGIVSAVTAGYRTETGERIDGLLRLDLAVYDGFSGGPLVAPSGGVVGVNNSAFTSGGAAALPVTVVDSVVDELLSRGHTRRPFIGVGVHPVALGAAAVRRYNLPHEAALIIVSLAEGEPADVAGVQLGDVLIGIAGKQLARPSDLLDALMNVADGEAIDIDVLRAGTQQTIRVTPRDRGGQAE